MAHNQTDEAEILTDLDGRAYARVSDVKAGDVLIADDGFTCIRPDAACKVMECARDGLYVACNSGEHLLDGQINGSVYVGLYPSEEGRVA